MRLARKSSERYCPLSSCPTFAIAPTPRLHLDDGELRRLDTHPTVPERTRAESPAPEGHQRAPSGLSRSCVVRDGPLHGPARARTHRALGRGCVPRWTAFGKTRLLLSVFKGAGKDGRHAGGPAQRVAARGKLRRFSSWKVRERECLDSDAPLFVSRLERRLSLRAGSPRLHRLAGPGRIRTPGNFLSTRATPA